MKLEFESQWGFTLQYPFKFLQFGIDYAFFVVNWQCGRFMAKTVPDKLGL